MNNRGQAFFVALMIGIVFLIFALATAPVIKQFSDDAMNSTDDTRVGLDCSNASIDTYTKVNCVAVDMFNPYFTGFLIVTGLAYLGAKTL